jgi:hypothetical protein
MKFQSIAFILLAALASGSTLAGSDLSRYRSFQLGMPLAEVANEIGAESPTARAISSRPERIDELDWRSNQFSSSSKPDSVREILFRFYNGGLFEMIVMYDRDHTSGLTDADMKEALTSVYGPGSASATKEMAFNAGYHTSARVIAQWADAQNAVSLVGLPYGGGFGVVVASSANQVLARGAILESDRLDREEAPQKELELRARQLADTAIRDEKSRLLNKPGFRP